MRLFLLVLYFLIPGILLRCSSSNLAGGGDDFPNSIVGIVVDVNGSPSSNTQVKLIPRNYNPVTDQPIPDSLIDTTDALGAYCIRFSESGSYNILAVHLFKKASCLKTGISISRDTTNLGTDTLKEPGLVKVFLPDTIDTAGGYLFVKGTTLLKSLSAVTLIPAGVFSLVMDSVPATRISGVYYDKMNDPAGPELITDTVPVSSNDTAETEAFVYWARYTTANSGLLENRVLKLHLAKDGALWASMFYVGLARFSGGVWTIYNQNNSFAPNLVFDIAQDQRGLLWCCTEKGLWSFDGSSWEVLDTSNTDLPSNYVTCIAVDLKNNLWIGLDKGIAIFNNYLMTFTIYDSTATGLGTNWIQDVTIESNNAIWFATDKGALRYDYTNWVVYNDATSGIPDQVTRRVAVDKNNFKWFGHSLGISRTDGKTWTFYDATYSPILGTMVRDIYVDDNNGVWVGTETGLTRFDGKTWHDYTDKRYLPVVNRRVESITKDASGNVWLGMYGDGVIGFGPTVK